MKTKIQAYGLSNDPRKLAKKYKLRREVSFEAKLIQKQIRLLKLTATLLIVATVASLLAIISIFTTAKPAHAKYNTETQETQIKLYKTGASSEQNELVQLAYKLGGLDFVYTIEAESGFRTDAKGYNRDGSYDYGTCQINSYYHMPILKSGLFVGKNQIYYCWDVWKDGQRKGRMPFVAFWSRWKAINNFEWR